jgi:hypothetical protein
MLSTYRTLSRARGIAEFVGPARAVGQRSIPVASVRDERSPHEPAHGPRPLGGRDHPTITFRAPESGLDPAHWKVTGDLCIRHRAAGRPGHALFGSQAPFSGKIAAAFRAETAIDRRDFGVTWGAAMDTGAADCERVQISLAILAVRRD